MDHLVSVLMLLPSLNPLDWFGLEPVEAFKEWLWPQPEPESFHPLYTLNALLKLVIIAAVAVTLAMILYWLIRWRLRSSGGGGPRGPGRGSSGTTNSREPKSRRYTERTGRRRR